MWKHLEYANSQFTGNQQCILLFLSARQSNNMHFCISVSTTIQHFKLQRHLLHCIGYCCYQITFESNLVFLNFNCNFGLLIISFLDLWHVQSDRDQRFVLIRMKGELHSRAPHLHTHKTHRAHIFSPDISLVHEGSITVYQHSHVAVSHCVTLEVIQ